MKFCGPALFFVFAFPCFSAQAAIDIPITVNLSENVTIAGTPRIAVDVGGTTRYATYTSGTGTNTLTFSLSPQAGDVDLDGVTVSSTIDLNGGTIKDSKGNDAALTFTPPGTSNVKVNYPSLGMDFIYDADGRYTLNGTVYNDLTSFLSAAGGTYTRASIGTYFDSTGTLQTATSGTPRFDYDPITHAAKGILIEEQRTNLLTYSDQFNNASWSKSNTSVLPDTAISLNRREEADKLVETTVNSQHSITKSSLNFTIGLTYTASIFVKAEERYIIGLVFPTTAFGSWKYASFNLQTGSPITVDSGVIASIIPIGSGWYRCSATTTATATATSAFSYKIQITGMSQGEAYTGDGTSGLYVWGAQMEAGAFPTSYIATTSAAVTRTADSLKIPTGGWYNSTEGTVYVHGGTGDTGATSSTAFFSFDDNTSNNRIQLRRANGTMKANMRIVTASTSVMDVLGPTVWTDSSIHDFAIAYKSSDNRYYMDGVYQSVSISGSPMPTITQLQIGYGTGSNYLDGPISKLKYYPARINNTQLQLLTQ